MKKILIVVDYQNDFVDPNGALPVPNADKLSNKIQNRINSDDYESIIYTLDTHTPEDYNGSEEQQLFPDIHCEFGTNGWNFFNIIPRYEHWNEFIESRTAVFSTFASNNEYFVTKDMFNVWIGNETYAKWFEKTFPSDKFEVDVVGVATNYCVYLNVMGMLERGYKVNILEDCVEGIKNFPDGSVDASFNQNITIMKNRGVKFI